MSRYGIGIIYLDLAMLVPGMGGMGAMGKLKGKWRVQDRILGLAWDLMGNIIILLTGGEGSVDSVPNLIPTVGVTMLTSYFTYTII